MMYSLGDQKSGAISMACAFVRFSGGTEALSINVNFSDEIRGLVYVCLGGIEKVW